MNKKSCEYGAPYYSLTAFILHGQQAAVPGAAAGEAGAVPPDTQAAGAQHDHQVITEVKLI